MKKANPARRTFIKHSVAGLFAVSSGTLYAAETISNPSVQIENEPISAKYPTTADKQVAEVVGASHSDFDKVKAIVTACPELARAAWDWGFGDWETALGAASHTGRRDIAELLITYGARPDIFTFAMMGAVDAVRSMVVAAPGIQRIPGPHGITLLQHAKNRLRRKDLSKEDADSVQSVVNYLESLGDADLKATSLAVSTEEAAMYLGEYKFGEDPDSKFEVSLNSSNMLQIKREGYFGRILNKVSEHAFAPAGAASVKIAFTVSNQKASAFTIHQPNAILTATRM